MNYINNYIFQLLSNLLGRSHDSPVGIEARVGTGRSGDRKAVRTTDSSFLLKVQTECGAHSTSYSMGFFSEHKAAEA